MNRGLEEVLGNLLRRTDVGQMWEGVDRDFFFFLFFWVGGENRPFEYSKLHEKNESKRGIDMLYDIDHIHLY